MGTTNLARTTTHLRAFDQQKRNVARADSSPQQELLGFSLGTPVYETAPKVIVKKNAGAVHSRSQLSCLERKLFNVCLYVAYDELADAGKLTHRVPISVISTLAGFDASKNTAHLKKAFRALVTSIVEWSIVDERGAETWEACAVLAGVRFRNGMCEFEFPWILREKLYQPDRYAPLELGEMRNLSTVGAIALCEHLVRYENMSRTPTFPVQLWRALLGADASTYDDFRRLNEKIIRPAVTQINTHTHLMTEPEFIRRDRRVVAMWFKIIDKRVAIAERANPPALEEGEGKPKLPDSPLARRLYEEMQLTTSQVEDVLRDHEEARIEEVLDYVGRRYQEGKVKSSLPAYFLGTLLNYEQTAQHSALDLRRKESESAKRQQEEAAKRLQTYRDAFKSVWRSQAQEALDNMDAAARETVFTAFEAYLKDMQSPALQQWTRTNHEASPALVALLRNFVAERYLPSREAAFEEWMKCQEAGIAQATEAA